MELTRPDGSDAGSGSERPGPGASGTRGAGADPARPKGAAANATEHGFTGVGGRGDAPTTVIWGAGAMGGSIGAALVRAGRSVLFVDVVEEHVRAMNEAGLRITGPVDDYRVEVRAALPQNLRQTYPLMLLCVKAHHTPRAVAELRPFLAEDGAVVSVQNGLCEPEIAAGVGWERTVGAFVNFGADYVEPGIIHRGNRGAVVVGEPNGATTPRILDVHGLFRLFEPEAVLTSNIFGFLWGKLAYAALLFATALTPASIADVLDSREHRRVLEALAREVVAVAQALGVRLEGFDGFDPGAFSPDAKEDRAGQSLDDLVSFNRKSAKTHSGIYRDLAVRKRKTEVDAQLGVVVRMGGEVGVPTPLTRTLVDLIHEIESGSRDLAWSNLAELQARS